MHTTSNSVIGPYPLANNNRTPLSQHSSHSFAGVITHPTVCEHSCTASISTHHSDRKSTKAIAHTSPTSNEPSTAMTHKSSSQPHRTIRRHNTSPLSRHITTNKVVTTELSGIPKNALLTDGCNSFMSTAFTDTVDISSWHLAMLEITMPPDSHDHFTLMITATSSDGTQTTLTSQPLYPSSISLQLPQLLLQLRQRVTKLTLSLSE